MTRPLAAHTRSIAKQTLLGVVAMLALVLGATVALAADGDGDPETTDTSETTETSVDTSETTDTTEADETETTDTTETTETTETTTTEPDVETGEPAPEAEKTEDFRNHGEAVSKAAREDCPPGPGHGACVSAVAKSDAGKKSGADEDVDEVEVDDDDEDEDEDLEPESESDESGEDGTDKRSKPDKARGKR